ncbi:MAG: hypothetical protein LBL67_04275 [Coriobacteriales bacterium]|jgi:hypothetical protein|nr:hypothetical protein [Coriobacteriales bacterium]
MQVKIYYQSGRVAVFDTANFTMPEPFGPKDKNILTNFELNLDSCQNEDSLGLYIDVYYYDIDPGVGKRPETATALRAGRKESKLTFPSIRSGYRLLLTDKEGLADVGYIEVDGKIVMWRQGDDLINANKFEIQQFICYNSTTAESYNTKVLDLFRYVRNAEGGREEHGPTDKQIAERLGYTEAALYKAMRDEAANVDTIEDEDMAGVGEEDESESDTPEPPSPQEQPQEAPSEAIEGLADEYLANLS